MSKAIGNGAENAAGRLDNFRTDAVTGQQNKIGFQGIKYGVGE